MSQATRKEMTKAAREIEAAATASRAKGLKDWKGDIGMTALVKKDAKDLGRVASWLREGKIDHAIDSAGILDTAVREQIPQAAWNLLEDHFIDNR